MIIVSGETIANMRIVRTLGLVRGTSVRGRAFGKDLMSASSMIRAYTATQPRQAAPGPSMQAASPVRSRHEWRPRA